ncbi:MAG: WD40/YVTN/BNR-like repeat-containing protein [Alcanivoracaceae bacterium]
MNKFLCSLGLMALLPVSTAVADVLTSRSPVVSANLYLDAARAGTRVVAVGDRGHILYSDDEGRYWSKAQTPTGVLLTAVCFADARNGWAVGHDAVVLGTRDGGQTWELQYSDALAARGGDDLDDDYGDDDYADDYDDYDDFGDDSAGNGGQDTSGAPLLDVVCLSKDRAIAVGGYGYVVETVNGRNWDKTTDKLDNREGWHLNAIARINGSDTLLAVGEKGLMYRSRDAGRSWAVLKSPYQGSYFGVMSLADGSVVAFGLQGNLWVSRNQGDSWRQVQAGVTRGINGGTVLADGTIVLVGGAGVVLVSRDNGNSFALQYLRDRESVSAVLPLTGAEMLMVGDAGIRVKNDIR